MTFATLEELFPSSPAQWPSISFGMYRAAANGSKRVELRRDVENVVDALWASDASGAVVISDKEAWENTGSNELLWVSTDSTKPFVLLPVNGGTLRWGK